MNNKRWMIAGLLVFLSLAAFSATTGSLVLTGTVNGVLDISVTAKSVATNLDLTISQTDLSVATVVEKSNKPSGYTVTLESGNAKSNSASNGILEDSVSGDSLSYTIQYDGANISLINGVATVTNSNATTASSGVSKDLSISYVGDNSLTEGSYSDTITLTIAAK